MSFFYVLYDEQLGFVSKESSESPVWTFRLDKAIQFKSSSLGKRFIEEEGYLGYMLKCSDITNENVIALARNHKKNYKYLRGK